MIRKLLFITLVYSGSACAEFAFPVHKPVIYRPNGRVYTAAQMMVPEEPEKKDKQGTVLPMKGDFSVAYSQRDMKDFVGITPKKVTINNEKDKPNPLHGAKIDHLALLAQRPVVTKKNRFFLIDDRANPITVFKSPKIKDANEDEARSLLAITTFATEAQISFEAGATFAALAAVPNKEGGFDGDGSGIAVGYFISNFNKKKKQFFMTWDLIDAATGMPSFDKDGQPSDTGNKALPFGKDTPELFIGQPVQSIDNAVDLHFDRDYGKMYMGLQVEAVQGARSVVVGSLQGGRLLLQKIAPDSAFDGTSSIVGQNAPGVFGVTNVRTMRTRTLVRYLIVVDRDNGVYALPLVDNYKSPAHGTLANVKVLPMPIFLKGFPYRFDNRVFYEPATQPDQLYTKDSIPARIGGNGMLPGCISDISVYNEAVIVSTIEGGPNPEKVGQGIFYSQPVFDEFGRISSWTDWQRTAGDASIKGFTYDLTAGKYWYVPDQHDREIKKTAWTNDEDDFERFISNTFLRNRGGVFGLFDFPFTTEGFNQRLGHRLSVQLFTGAQVVFLLQTGADRDGLFTQGFTIKDRYVSTTGKLDGFKGESALIMSGGALKQLGPITSAAVITDDSNGWFVVGGAGGIAVLADKDGGGWPLSMGLSKEFEGLTPQHEWKIIRTTPNIRKLIVKDGHLFALSPLVVERLKISQEAIKKEEVAAVILKSIHEDEHRAGKSFSDFYVKGPVGILATSFGLFHSTTDVRTTKGATPWKELFLPEGAGSLSGVEPVSRIYGIQAVDDNLYILNAHVSLNQSFIYRLVVKNDKRITDDTVTLFPDFFIKGQRSYFLDLGNYRNYLTTDGSFIAVSRSAFGSNKAFIQLLPPFVKSGDRIATQARPEFLPRIKDAQTVGPLVRNSASGAWLATGNFGVRRLK